VSEENQGALWMGARGQGRLTESTVVVLIENENRFSVQVDSQSRPMLTLAKFLRSPTYGKTEPQRWWANS